MCVCTICNEGCEWWVELMNKLMWMNDNDWEWEFCVLYELMIYLWMNEAVKNNE